MTTIAKRKLDGILSLVWASLGYFLLPLIYHFNFSSTALLFLILFGAWWGVSMLLAISGLKSGSRVSILASVVTILLFVYFLQSLVPRIHT
jgi:hypothetical protein